MSEKQHEENTWNHRVIRLTETDPVTNETYYYYQIHEVHYTNGVPSGVTENPVPVAGEDTNSLKWTLERMLFAADKEIIPMEYFDNLPPIDEDALDRLAEQEEEEEPFHGPDLGGC